MVATHWAQATAALAGTALAQPCSNVAILKGLAPGSASPAASAHAAVSAPTAGAAGTRL